MSFQCWLFAALWVCGVFAAGAQSGRKVKTLQSQKKEMQKDLDRSRKELKSTEKDVASKMRDIHILTNQIENRQRYIDTMEVQIRALSAEAGRLQAEVERTERDLEKKKEDYAKALRYARVNRSAGSPLLFILSSHTVTQMYRRSRYAREYADYQHRLGERIVEKRNELLKRKDKLLAVKAENDRLVAECEKQKALLQQQHEEETKNVAGLQKRQKVLEKEVEEQRRQLAALDRKIDELIAWEVEQERKRAEAEARKKAARQRKAKATSSGKKQEESAIPSEYKWITPQDQALNGSFVRNKGRLPVPITGNYMLGSRFGVYNVPGLKNVKLDNKGTNYVGRPGAMARSVFDGVVSAVFQFGGTRNVMVRHGSYISVYCNLSSVRVAKGQEVKARDILGKVEDDGNGHCVLHFQLRKETQKLNPEVWIGR